MSRKTSRKPLKAAELQKLADNFGRFSDESGSDVDIDNECDFHGDSDEDFVPREEVSESEDDVEIIVNEEPIDEEPTNEITEIEEPSDEYVSKSGLKWSTIPKPVTRRLQRNIVIVRPGPTRYVQNAVTPEDIFNLLITDEIKEIICRYTNEEAARYVSSWNEEHPDRQKKKNTIAYRNQN